MAWVLILPIAFLAIFGRRIYRSFTSWSHVDFGDRSMGVMIALIFAMGLGWAGFLVALIFGAFMPQQWVQTGTTTLVSLRDGSSASGSFFLGSGTIESEPYYYYYVGTPESGYSPRQLKAYPDTLIFEEERADGKLIQFTKVLAPNVGVWWWFAAASGTRYEFHIPKGSLRQQFSVG